MKAQSDKYRVAPHTKVKLDKIPTDVRGPYESEEEANADTEKHRAKLTKLQDEFAAEKKGALLVVLQAMDGGGKDGTIRHIFTGVNPQGCTVTGFKVPTPLELSHDFLWRVHAATPAKGMIGIFNRSHYEDVLVTGVHKLITPKVVKQRFEAIRNFEQLLEENGTTILKFFLHISKREQTARLRARVDMADKQWKISTSDFKERKYWDKYQEAYADAISETSRKHAPWYIIPADHKWYRNVVVSEILVNTLEKMKLRYPAPTVDVKTLKF